MNSLLIFLTLSTANRLPNLNIATRYGNIEGAILRLISYTAGDTSTGDEYMYLCDQKEADPLIFMIESDARLTHEEFEGRLHLSKRGLNDDDDEDDEHGTAVGSRIIGKNLGFARNSVLNVLSDISYDGYFYENATYVDDYLRYVKMYTNRPIIVNISSGMLKESCMYVNELIKLGITVITSAGNDGKRSEDVRKCQIEDIIVVGATNYTESRYLSESLAIFSNFGSSVTLYAPGVDVFVAGNESDTDYLRSSGTSFSAPLISGFVVKLLEQKPNATPKEVKEQLIRMSVEGLIHDMLPDSTNRFLQVDLSSEKAACNLWKQEKGAF